jgi:hypothetical protein
LNDKPFRKISLPLKKRLKENQLLEGCHPLNDKPFRKISLPLKKSFKRKSTA